MRSAIRSITTMSRPKSLWPIAKAKAIFAHTTRGVGESEIADLIVGQPLACGQSPRTPGRPPGITKRTGQGGTRRHIRLRRHRVGLDRLVDNPLRQHRDS